MARVGTCVWQEWGHVHGKSGPKGKEGWDREEGGQGDIGSLEKEKGIGNQSRVGLTLTGIRPSSPPGQ